MRVIGAVYGSLRRSVPVHRYFFEGKRLLDSCMQNITILLVDDHVLIRQGCRRILEHSEGLLVVGEAQTGEEALEKIEELKPSLVLMDLNLPGVGGLEMTRRIKS